MSDPRFKHIGTPPDQLIEECSELILAICKGERFGWLNFNPDDPRLNNIESAFKEIEDVEEKIIIFKNYLENFVIEESIKQRAEEKDENYKTA